MTRIRGAVLGMAVGDAIGFPFRGLPPEALAQREGLASEFAARPRVRYQRGQFSDDTQLMLAAAESVLREGRVDGRSWGAHLAWSWREGILLQTPSSVVKAAQRLTDGVPWMSAGAPQGQRDPSVLSRALVVGLTTSDAVARLPQEAAILAVVTHRDALCAAGAAAYARAVATLLSGETSPEAVCRAAADAAEVHEVALGDELRCLPGLFDWEIGNALGRLREIGVPPGLLGVSVGLPPHLVPVLMCALFVALRCGRDFSRALELLLRMGGEADVAVALCGGLLGAAHGIDVIPPRLRTGVSYARHLEDVATRLHALRMGAVAQGARTGRPARSL